MKIKQGFTLHRIGNDCMVMNDGTADIDLSRVINLNLTAAMLWEVLQGEDFDADRVTAILTNHYPDHDKQQLAHDAAAFVRSLTEAGLTEP